MASYNHQNPASNALALANGMASLSVDSHSSGKQSKYNQNGDHATRSLGRRRSSASSGSGKGGRHSQKNQNHTVPEFDGANRRRGVVKFFNSQKGFGFIIPNDPSEINVNGLNESMDFSSFKWHLFTFEHADS